MATAVKDVPWRRAGSRRRTRRRLTALARRVRTAETTWLVGLCGLSVLIGLGTAAGVTPTSMFVVPVLLGGLSLTLSRLIVLLVVVGGAYLSTALSLGSDLLAMRVGSLVVLVISAVVMLFTARSRSRLGVGGSRGETMLIDLRDRLLKQGELPALPRAWYAEAVMRSAGGASFAGDFMVSARSEDGTVLEVTVVDVSGKGLDAGTRALLLSGAFGGLIGSVPPDEFLPAANAYLLRQEWGEGFATAVYLTVNLRTGEFEIRTAGHPPAVQLHAGSGRWAVQASEGPVLGLMKDAQFTVAHGRLQGGDVLLLYTDGLVETPQRDISLGIDKLLGEADRLATRGFDRGATRLVDRIASQNDDRALLLLHRRAPGRAIGRPRRCQGRVSASASGAGARGSVEPLREEGVDLLTFPALPQQQRRGRSSVLPRHLLCVPPTDVGEPLYPARVPHLPASLVPLTTLGSTRVVRVTTV